MSDRSDAEVVHPASRPSRPRSSRPADWPGRLLIVLGLVPAAWLAFAFFSDRLSANPIDDVLDQTGLWALRFLLICLAVTPLRRLTGHNPLIRFRRPLGLFSFFYACLHLLTYLGLDQGFAFAELLKDVIKRPFITVGAACFLLLLPLALTSTRGMIRRLGGKRWQRLHKLVYPAGVGAVIHFFWVVKLDTREPLIYAGALALLLGARGYFFVRSHPAFSARASSTGRL